MYLNRLFYVAAWCLLLLGTGACEEARKPRAETGFVTVTDDLGRRLRVPRRPRRVLGLAPSATEMLFAVADPRQIVGRTQACDYPAQVKSKPVVHSYPLDYEQLVMLKPDLVVTVEGITSPEAAAKLAELHIPVYFQKFDRVEDVLSGLNDLGRLLNRPARARQLTDSLRRELSLVQAAAPARPAPRVLAITWTDPIYVYGQNTLLSDKLRLIGAQNALTEVFAQPYPALTREYILQLNPDVILGGTFEKMEATFFSVYPELRQLKAYRQKRIYHVDDDLMARPGPRVVTSMRELKKLLF